MQDVQQEPIAIIGMGCRFPRANNLQEFWTLLCEGKDAIREVPADRWDIEKVYDPDSTSPGKTVSRWGGFLDQVDQFDWRTFRMLPREATYMDPQHRLLLEVAWEALEDAGLPFEEVAGSQTSVSIGIGWSDYLRLQARNWSQLDEYTAMGNANSFAANRLSYMFDLKGPSVSVDSGCTSSLTALYLACQSLWAGETHLALAGGVNLMLSPDSMIMTSKAGLLSGDGRCKTLDADADGFVRGEGAGLVVLKPLSQVRRSDRVYALIRGIAVNHNGRNEWIIASSQTAQEALLRDSYRKAGVNPAFVDYVELHGTGFLRGDTIETKALGAVLGNSPERTHSCFVGSVKTNIGHLEAASGIASVIKVALSLSHQHIPPTLNLQTLNPDIPLDDLHLAVPQQGISWPERAIAPQVAGVTTLAFTGTNAHAVLTAPPDTINVRNGQAQYTVPTIPFSREQKKEGENVYRLLPLSARSKQALYGLAEAYRDFLMKVQTTDTVYSWRDICYSASVRRTHHSHRLAVLGSTPQEAADALSIYLQEQRPTGNINARESKQEQDQKQMPIQLALLDRKNVEAREKPNFYSPTHLQALSNLYTSGHNVDWSELYQMEECHCVSLPAYVWQRERLWPDWLDVKEISTPPEERSAAPRIKSHRKDSARLLSTEMTGREVVEVLMELWADVLGLEKVDSSESFFELGGHSLLAAQLVARVRRVLAVEVPLAAIFEAPTAEGLAQWIEQARSRGEGISVPPLVAAEHPDVIPLSFAQQSMWFLDQMESGSTAYLVPRAYRLYGELDIRSLEQAFNELIQRHESLRTTFPQRDGEVVQMIHQAEEAWLLPIIDLQGLEPLRREQEAQRLARQEAQHPSDLARGPLLRLSLLRLVTGQAQGKGTVGTGLAPIPAAPQEHVLLLTQHHIITDGWSTGILVEELSTLYQANVSRQSSPLAPLPIQYADYTLWQRQWLQGEVLQRQVAYWRNQLADLSPLALPTDYPRPKVKSSRGATQEVTVSQEVLEGLQHLCQQQDVTLFMLLLAAFQILLLRYTGQSDISVGTPIANRRQAEVEGVIGCFVNTLVLRTDLSGNPTCVQVLRRVHEVCLGAYANQDVPFKKVVEELQPQRDLRYSPLFQVMLVLQNASRARESLTGMSIEPLVVENTTSKFDMLLSISEMEQGLHCALEYNTDLFKADTITRWLTHWYTLLQGAVQDPQARVTDLPLLAEDEQEQLLMEWNATQADYPQDRCIHQLFEQQVEQTPEAVAVVFEETSLTYRELNSQANHLAHRLLRAGIGPDVLAGVCMERSLSLVVALLAVLKAGGAYVPLDPDYPQERLTFLLEDAQVPVVLTQAYLRDRFSLSTVELICVEPDSRESTVSASISQLAIQPANTASQDRDNPPCWVRPDNMAYMIYTSGSTGKPKGAMNTHRGICNRLHWMQQAYQLTPEDGVLQKTPFSFDVSVWEFFWPLLTGARLIIARPDGHRDPTYLSTLMTREQVTTLHFVPSMLQAFLGESHLRNCTSLRQLMCSGEALTPSLQARFFADATERVKLHNLYGPTEAAIDVTFWLCQPHSQDSGVPIGYPIANTQIYILDRNLQPVPIGVTGELYIGGVGLARGYWGRPDLTAERFIPNPFFGTRQAQGTISTTPVREGGERLYRTGDLARYQADGAIEYLGRTDHQVKIRGFRIELSEIEMVLFKHPDIQESVVSVWEKAPDDKRLVAYLVAEDSKKLSTSELRRYLQDKLPEYMVPAIFVLLEELPQTPNGKLDRAALPPPDPMRSDPDSALVLARTPTEEVLAAIWASVLSREVVGIHENFFELGGDSIRSIQVLSQARQRGLHFSLQQLFQQQTIYGLVQVLSADAQRELLTEPLQAFSLITPQDLWGNPIGFAADVEDAYPLTTLQAGMVFHSQYASTSAIYHDIFSYHLVVPFNSQMLQTALEQLAACHPILRTSFDLSTFSEPLQLVHRSVAIPLQIQDLSMFSPTEQEQRLRAWLEQEKSSPFIWTQPPLLRLQIHLRSESSFQLTLSFYHAVLDGWSVAFLLTELMKAYLSLLLGNDATFVSQPSFQFRDFVALERKVMASQEVKQYWLEKLQGSISVRLPRWTNVQQAASDTVVETLPVPISDEAGASLKRIARELAVPLKSVLLAAHLRVLSLLHGQEDILTGLVSNGRPEVADGERTLGLFLSTLPFRMKLSGGTWIELIREVFAAECELLPYRWYPLAEIQKQRGIQTPFETLFNFMHFHVYQDLLSQKYAFGQDASSFPFQVLGEDIFESTNFTLVANFSLDLISSQIHLSLQCDLKELCVEQIQAIGGYYAQVLIELAADPSGRYEWQALLSAQEREQLLVTWNATQIDYPQDRCIHQLFEQQVEQTPEAVAVTFEGTSLTYRELNRRANQLAHHLQSLGVGPEVLVGICLSRSIEMIVGLLGVLKAGGAYVPIDPTYPQERLAFMLQDSQIPVLLTQQRLIEAWPEPSFQVIPLDVKRIAIEQECEENPVSDVCAESLASVIYTSGSTGRPKGVLATHRATLNRLQWMWEYFPFEAEEICCQKTSLSFVDSVWEIFGPLLQGIRTVLIADEVLKNPHGLIQTLARERITRIVLVPSLLHILLNTDVDLQNQLPRLKYWTSSGEALSIDLTVSFLNRLPQKVLINLYGSSEVAADATCYDIRDWKGLPCVPIGRPIANTQIYILDRNLQPMPIGVPGELYIGGVGLALGYCRQPELTAERFIPNPFVGTKQARRGDPLRKDKPQSLGVPTVLSQPGARLYRTGDLARYRADGTIEYLGRIDQQVKLRGFRIELGEIEATLRRHPAVEEAVVVLHEEDETKRYLIAYVMPISQYPPTDQRNEEGRAPLPTSPDADNSHRMVPSMSSGFAIEPAHRLQAQPTQEELQSYLREQLPNYMVPAIFVYLETLPLTPNGKTDRSALPVPTRTALRKEDYVAPQSEIEHTLVGIWQQVLGLEQIGIRDNFFEAGGDSLMGLRIMNQLGKIFKVDLSMHLLFTMPTVEGMAEVIMQKFGEEILDDEQLAEVLENVSQMSEEEALQLLEKNFSAQEIER